MDHPCTMRALLPKRVRGYVLDAVEAPHAAAATAGEAAEFLQRVGKAEPLMRPAVGVGEEIRLTGEDIAGRSLGRAAIYSPLRVYYEWNRRPRRIPYVH
jgi:hypothetical protein